MKKYLITYTSPTGIQNTKTVYGLRLTDAHNRFYNTNFGCRITKTIDHPVKDGLLKKLWVFIYAG